MSAMHYNSPAFNPDFGIAPVSATSILHLILELLLDECLIQFRLFDDDSEMKMIPERRPQTDLFVPVLFLRIIISHGKPRRRPREAMGGHGRTRERLRRTATATGNQDSES